MITAKDYEWALAKISELWDAAPDSDEGRYFMFLAAAVQEYEDAVFPSVETDAVDAILFRMDQMGWKQKDVAHLFGGESHTSEVLNRRRPLSPESAVRVHELMGIPMRTLTGNSNGQAADINEDYNDDRRGRKTELDQLPSLAIAA